MDILKSEPVWVVTPKPAFCVKLVKNIGDTGENEKVFFNICTCDELPAPVEDIDEDRLAVVLESPDPGSFRIPISVGEPRMEEDKRGQSCKTYDIILNQSFYSKRVKDCELFRAFLVLIAIDAVETKYDERNIDRRNWITLKNRKCVGELKTQTIRKKPRPQIQELEESENSDGAADGENSTTIEPKYEIRKDNAEKPTRIITTLQLDGVKCVDDIRVDIGEHRIRVVVKDKRYEADIYVDMVLNEKYARAKFFIDDAKLVVEVPLL